jgi:hypothetical protein
MTEVPNHRVMSDSAHVLPTATPRQTLAQIPASSVRIVNITSVEDFKSLGLNIRSLRPAVMADSQICYVPRALKL